MSDEMDGNEEGDMTNTVKFQREENTKTLQTIGEHVQKEAEREQKRDKRWDKMQTHMEKQDTRLQKLEPLAEDVADIKLLMRGEDVIKKGGKAKPGMVATQEDHEERITANEKSINGGKTFKWSIIQKVGISVLTFLALSGIGGILWAFKTAILSLIK